MRELSEIAAAILGAKWFFAVIFIVSMVFAVPWMSELDERHVDKGDKPHLALFTVVYQPGIEKEPFGYSKYNDLAQVAARKPAPSFTMTAASGKLQGGRQEVVAYQVLSTDAKGQLIEVRFTNSTYDSWSRYRVTGAEVTPVFSKIKEPGQMIKAIPVALGIAFAIYVVGRLLQRRVARDSKVA